MKCNTFFISFICYRILLRSLFSQDITDTGLLTIGLTLTGLSLWFCLLKGSVTGSHTSQKF